MPVLSENNKKTFTDLKKAMTLKSEPLNNLQIAHMILSTEHPISPQNN